VVRTVVSVMLWSNAPLTCDRLSTGSSLVGLFLGGISWVFCQAHEHDGCQCWDLLTKGYKS
jgi:hypothetical protein